MPKTAVLVDLAYFIRRYRGACKSMGVDPDPKQIAKAVWDTAVDHLTDRDNELYRILVYDCRPLAKKTQHPITGKPIDFSKSHTYQYRLELHRILVSKRKVALRCGELQDGARWLLKPEPLKRLLRGAITVKDLVEDDVAYDFRQKGVDIKIGIDIASLAYKKLVEKIVLITGDSDFVPAAKLARREGIDVVLNPLFQSVTDSLSEHIDGLESKMRKPGQAPPTAGRELKITVPKLGRRAPVDKRAKRG